MSVFFLQRLVKYILKQDTPTSLEDALKIVATYMLPTVEVYILRMIDLIDKERVLTYFMQLISEFKDTGSYFQNRGKLYYLLKSYARFTYNFYSLQFY